MAQIWSSLRVLYAVKILSSSDPYQLTFYYSIWSGILSNIQSDILSGILFAFYLCVRVRAFYAPHSSPSSPWVSSEIASLELSLAVRSVSVAMRQGGGWSRRKKERKGGARNCTVIKSRGLHLAAEKKKLFMWSSPWHTSWQQVWHSIWHILCSDILFCILFDI